MASLEEDFTFPAAAGGGESPPLWRPTAAYESPAELKLISFQEFEKRRSKSEKIGYTPEDEEEKMDVLWEDLNDECSRSCGDCSSPGTGVAMSCAKPLRLSRGNRQMFSGKKPIILVLIKVVKKVLLLKQNSHRIKKQAW
ncbi:malate dehydrogenase [Striga asiatica]|uniref:Malate dehydrogenase n=1 Tax=Striga asiatica TaxID=4170 RepID=A0A5A7P446_STRAF|nr:malate dehydrogenase [Striga asiatica]